MFSSSDGLYVDPTIKKCSPSINFVFNLFLLFDYLYEEVISLDETWNG